MLPAVLGLSVMRLVRLPRDLWAGRAMISPRRRPLCALAFGVLYCALGDLHDAGAVRRWRAHCGHRPRTIHELFAAAFVAVAYPLVYLAFEWVLYYSVKPVPRA